MNRSEGIGILFMAVILIAALVYFYSGYADCTQEGGDYVRAVFGFKCIK